MTSTTSAPLRQAGPLGGVTGTLVVMEHFWLRYRRNWTAGVVSGVLQPLIALLAFGLALGPLVTPGPATANVEYLVFLAPGLLAMTAVQVAAVESSYPVHACFRSRHTYFAMITGPLTAAQVVAGQLGWIAARILVSCGGYLAVIVVIGGAHGPGSVLALVFATVSGMAMAAPIVAFAASIDKEGGKFGVMFRFVILPMTLFAGTFFPVSVLPAGIRPLAWISPLWHGTELARGAVLGSLRLLPATGHLGYLLVVTAVGVVLAARQFRARLFT